MRRIHMGKKKNVKPKKKCCRKYQKKSKYCKRCPVKLMLQCQLKRRILEVSKKKAKKKAEKKAAEKACAKKSCKKKAEKKSCKKKGDKNKCKKSKKK